MLRGRRRSPAWSSAVFLRILVLRFLLPAVAVLRDQHAREGDRVDLQGHDLEGEVKEGMDQHAGEREAGAEAEIDALASKDWLQRSRLRRVRFFSRPKAGRRTAQTWRRPAAPGSTRGQARRFRRGNPIRRNTGASRCGQTSRWRIRKRHSGDMALEGGDEGSGAVTERSGVRQHPEAGAGGGEPRVGSGTAEPLQPACGGFGGVGSHDQNREREHGEAAEGEQRASTRIGR